MLQALTAGSNPGGDIWTLRPILTEMNTKDLAWSKQGQNYKADNFIAIHGPIV
jgi:hypothetical protein